MDTTIKVDAATRDRLSLVARERGITIRELVTRLASETLTRDELQRRGDQAEEYVRTRIAPDLSHQDLADAESVWRAVEAGEAPEGLPNPARRPRAA
ncbi:hypothetical protein [Micromonospora echinospora]|uniref:hypothetical protein n=1 Tax=Micromonospora echinospora TaxID=1877 RepID=UPI00366BA859